MKVKHCLFALCGLAAVVYAMDNASMESAQRPGARAVASEIEAQYEPCRPEEVFTNSMLFPRFIHDQCIAAGVAQNFDVGTEPGKFTHFRRRVVCDSAESLTHHYILYSDSQCLNEVAEGYTSAMVVD